jgi:hypothetical protein
VRPAACYLCTQPGQRTPEGKVNKEPRKKKIMVIYVSPHKNETKTTMSTDLKKILLTEVIGEVIQGVTILDPRGVPVIHHLPNTLTAKTLRQVSNLIELVNIIRQNQDESLGDFQYVMVKYMNYKVGIFELPNKKGWLIVFINPLWHIENVIPKIRQFSHKIAQVIT